MGLEPRAARAGRAGWRPLGLGSGSYRSAAGVGMQGGPASGTGQPAGRRHATRGSAGLPRCPHRRPCLHGPRSATRLPLPPPVSRVTPPQPAAPARAPCTHRRTFAGGSPRSTWGGRGHGVVPWEKLRTPAPASGSKQHGDKLGRRTDRESLEPPPASAELTPRPQPPGRLAGAPVYFRGYTAPPRRSSEADRPREGVPATPGAPAPASPRGAPGAARTPPLDPAPSRRRAGLGTGSRAAGEAGERRAPLG